MYHIIVRARLTQSAPLSAVVAFHVATVMRSNEGHIVATITTQLDLDLLLVYLSTNSVGAFHRYSKFDL